MKQLKFLMVALTLLMGIAFTSCLNSDDGEYDDIYGMVLVNNYMGLLSFEDAAGNTYQPTSASVTQFEANSSLKISDSRMGIILGKSIEPETNEKSKTTNFTLKNFQPISFANAVVSMTAESLVVDAPETAPVITLKLENGSVQPFLYNKDILVTPIAWRLQNDNDKFKMHKFALACVLDEIEDLREKRKRLINIYKNDEDVEAQVFYCREILKYSQELTAMQIGYSVRQVQRIEKRIREENKL